MTTQEAARTALECQDACNLTGVVHAFSRAMHSLRETYPNENTEFFNRHCVVTLFLSKLCDLNRGYFECDYLHASNACEALVRGETVEYAHQQGQP